MSPEETTTREKILNAAIGLLAKSDPETITIRQIAARAEVNIAAINYHFRSKENLIDEAAYTFSSTSFALGMQLLKNRDIDPAERLRQFLKGYAKGLVEYRGVTKTAFQGSLASVQSGGRYARFTREMFEAVKGILRELSGEQDETLNARKTLIVFSGVIFPFLFHELFGEVGGVEYRTPAERDQYIELLVRTATAKKE